MKHVLWPVPAIILIAFLSGCSNPWHPYPYINAQPTDKPRPEKAQTIQPESTETPGVSAERGLDPDINEQPLQEERSGVESNPPLPLMDEPNFPDEQGPYEGQVPVPTK